jgi:hypothetical protein
MKDIVEMVLQRPIAALIVIGATAGGVANIIRATKGSHEEPFVRITVNKHNHAV